MTSPDAPPTPASSPGLPPVRRQAVVRASPARAFQAWTDELGAWWPFHTHSVCGERATAAFTDGRLVETGPDGTTHVWGTVTTWLPGRRLTMTWHPGQGDDVATTVDVRFDRLDDGVTLVTLTHSGWENRPDAADARDDYRTGWASVIGEYVTVLGTSADPVPQQAGEATDVTWLVLEHAVWAPETGDVFSDPRFGDHVSFLRSVDQRGWLVAAGNLPDSPGSGMTVLRVPDADVGAAVAAAQDEDLSVAGALFGVHVRPWNVALSAQA